VSGFCESGNDPYGVHNTRGISWSDEAILAFRKVLGSMEHSLFNDTDRSSVYTVSNNWDGRWIVNWKKLGRRQSWHRLGYYHGI